MAKLTGNIRYRVRSSLFSTGLVVLQVEEEWGDGPDDFHGLPTFLAGKGWRDAIPEDLQHINGGK